MAIAEIKVNLKAINDFPIFKEKIRKNVIENGLDKNLKTSVQKLKEDLRYIINTRMQNIDTTDQTDSKDVLGNEKIKLPRSDQEIIKLLTDADISKINKSKNYTTLQDNGAIVINNYRARLRIPISPNEEFDAVFQKAKDFFNKALFVVQDGNEVKYLKNPGIDISRHVKVVCSTDVGDTARSKKVFQSYRDSTRREAQTESQIGRYAEWTLKQDAVRDMMRVNSGFINLTPMVNDIKEGDFDKALDRAKHLPDKNIAIQTAERVEKLQKKGDGTISPNSKSYYQLTQLIRNLTVQKQIYNEFVLYMLVSSFSSSLDEISGDKLYDEIRRGINFWVVENADIWVHELIMAVQRTVNEFYK